VCHVGTVMARIQGLDRTTGAIAHAFSERSAGYQAETRYDARYD
jgi:hypothetical protein